MHRAWGSLVAPPDELHTAASADVREGGPVTRRLLPFNASTHASVDALLPFYVNATLQGDELALVEQHVRACEICQDEVDWLRVVFADLATGSALSEAPHAVVGLLQRSGERQTQSNWSSRIQLSIRTSPPWTRWLLAAQLAAIALLGTFLAAEVRDNASYRTLGSPTASAQLRDVVAVMFDPGTSEAELRQIVNKVGARIVDGPTMTDVFVLEIPAEHIEEALKALRTERSVRLAERLGPRPSR